MPFFVLRSFGGVGDQTRLVASYRNGRRRLVAFEKSCDADAAATIVSANPEYSRAMVRPFRVNGARLSADFGETDIGLDFCAILESPDDGGSLSVVKSCILKKRAYSMDEHRDRLERDFRMECVTEGPISER